MKYLLGIGIFLLNIPAGFAQKQALPGSDGIRLSYDDNSSGRNLNVTYAYTINKKLTVYGGLRYFINSKNFKNDYTLFAPYFKELTAFTFVQHIGLKAGLDYTFYQPNPSASVFAFCDLQAGRANIYNSEIFDYSAHAGSVAFGYNMTVSILENTLGLGTRICLSDQFLFRLQAGVGMNYYWNAKIYDKTLSPRSPPSDLHLGGNRRLPLPPNRMISAGIEYRLRPSRQAIPHNQLPAKAIQLSYNNAQTTYNFSVAYKQRLLPQTYIYGGLRVQVNSKFHVDYTRVKDSYYKKQFRADNLMQHLGLKAGIEQYYRVPRTNLTLFGFYDLQVSRANIRNLAYIDYFISGVSRASAVNTQIFESVIAYRICGPVTAIENYFGTGACMGLSDRLKLKVQAGLGVNAYIRPDVYQPYTITYVDPHETIQYPNTAFDAPKTELSKMFSIGLEYSIL